ncbi:MAG: flavodoxin family protein [Candidatus Heimdallarchaeaceae archaeon]
MKVIAINSSPLGDKGNTAMILNPLLEGMKDSGAEVSLYFTKDLEINPCCGEFTCSINNIDCFQDDDMQDIHPNLLEADIWVFATPLYISSVNGSMKIFMDRMLIPWGEPSIGFQDGRSHHIMRKKHENGKVLLVSSCGYWELDNFDHLLDYMKEFCFHAEREFLGSILRPHAPILKYMQGQEEKLEEIKKAAYESGKKVIDLGNLDSNLIETISQPLIPIEHYVRK